MCVDLNILYKKIFYTFWNETWVSIKTIPYNYVSVQNLIIFCKGTNR